AVTNGIAEYRNAALWLALAKNPTARWREGEKNRSGLLSPPITCSMSNNTLPKTIINISRITRRRERRSIDNIARKIAVAGNNPKQPEPGRRRIEAYRQPRQCHPSRFISRGDFSATWEAAP